ncbi:slipin family protein [Candidatus Micrarchaeota archaeon]|nr:slipin family protein [Candidatus Micrarchaeota archaeon]MBU1930262.1 slipin family protein [Candidatus Micrarchaeota archaeon]
MHISTTKNFEIESSTGKKGPIPIGVVIGLIIIILAFIGFLATIDFILLIIGLIIGFLAMLSIRIAAEWERVVILRLGRYSRMAGPGLFWVIPFFETTYKVDLRVRVWDVRPQEIMSSDSVPVEVDAVVYYQITEPKNAIMKVEDFAMASVKLAQTTLRDIVGKSDLDRLLMKKEEIGHDIQKILDKATDLWGIKVISVEIKDVVLPEMLKRAMAKEAEASREKKARLIKASAEQEAAANFEKAAKTMLKNPAAMQLRQLQTWQEIGAEQNSLMILIPTDFAKSAGSLGVVGLGDKILKQMDSNKKPKKE